MQPVPSCVPTIRKLASVFRLEGQPAPKGKMSRPLFAIAFGALQNRDEAEDVVQDAFVKAWKSR